MPQNRPHPQLTFGELVKIVLEHLNNYEKFKEDFEKHKKMVSCLLNNQANKSVNKCPNHEGIITVSDFSAQSPDNNRVSNFHGAIEEIDIHKDLMKIEKGLTEVAVVTGQHTRVAEIAANRKNSVKE